MPEGSGRSGPAARDGTPVELLPSITCADHVATDEAALRAGRPLVRVARLADRVLSVGAGVPEGAPLLRRARDLGWAIVRRGTGGTGVVHLPGDLAWSVVLPRSDPRVGPAFSRAYDRLGRGVVRFLDERRVAARWGAPPALSEACCFLSSRGQVLWAGSAVLGGAAQHVTRDALLHHGAVPWDVDPGPVAELFELSPTTVADRLTGLGRLGCAGPSERLLAPLAASVRAALDAAAPALGA